MKAQMLKLTGTELTLIVKLAGNDDAPALAQQLDGWDAQADSVVEPTPWQPMSRNEAVLKHPSAWGEELPHWRADNPTDVERMAWVRERLSDRLIASFDHIAAMAKGEEITGPELSELAGFDHPGSWGSATASAAVHTRRVGRQAIWTGRRAGGVWQFWMEEDVRTLWRMTED